MKLLIVACIFSGLFISSNAYAEMYKLTSLKRVDKDIYTFESGNARGVIATKYCYELVYFEDAILKYEQYSYDNKIIFNNGSMCEVASVIVR